MNKKSTETLKLIKNGTVQIIPEEDLIKKLERGNPLRIKLGMDPTAPDLHLGHAVVLSKMRQFQDLGHEVIFLIGDYTTRIGDPTGRSKTRPPLSEEDIKKNAKTYFDQVCKILDPKKTIVRYNSEWLSLLSFADVIQLAGKVTLARLIEREDFQKRLTENISIGFHELLYPLMQGYDSVALKADVELGGTDQTFNLLMGRFLQEQYHQEPQVILTMPLLEGLDGVNKMSKSLGNYIGLWESADNAFGKLMSVSDNLMWRYYHLLLNKTEDEIAAMHAGITTEALHPMTLKKEMAAKIIARFWSTDEATTAQQTFEFLFQKRDFSKATEVELPAQTSTPLWIVDLLKYLKATTSSSEAKRLIEASAVDVDEKTITDFKAEITLKSGMIIRVGKHKFYKLK
jgi:tyrosyl-tRNA synthetase